jgi:hypothetical protein
MLPMIPSLCFALPLFGIVVTGLAWPLVARRSLDPAEKIVATVALSLLAVFLFGWIGFVAHLPVVIHWALPLLALGGLAVHRAELVATWRDPAARELLLGQIVVTGWCLGWLALVVTYSGGGWAADWYEHWERTRFLLERGPTDAVFIGHASVTARPPLANVVLAALLSLTHADFAHYQLVSTLLASLAFAPAALLARRFGGTAAIPVAAALFMLNPLFVQNATFAWTKLPTAFFLLGALSFFLRATGSDRPMGPALLFSACLAAAILTHYSAGPYAVVLAVAWLVRSWARRLEPVWWRATAAASALGTLLLATWFGWAFAVYGAGATLLANTSVQAADSTAGGQLLRVALNLRDTLVPHFLRPHDAALIAQPSPWGCWRDWFFQSYQVNLIFALGSVAWLVLGAALWRAWSGTRNAVRLSWAAAVTATVVIGVAVHGARDTWGLAHICLQPVVLLGLAGLAGHAKSLSRPWRLALVAGATVDFALGLVLHFGVQNLACDRWFTPGRTFDEIFATYNQAAFMNIAAKVQHQLAFFSDVIALPLPLIAGGLAALLALAVWRLRA